MVTSHPGGRGAFIAVGSESQISVDQVTLYSSNQRNTQMSGYFFGGGEHAQKPKFGDGCFSVKKKLHTPLGSVQFLASFISFYFEILS